jgi:hypothetical protein
MIGGETLEFVAIHCIVSEYGWAGKFGLDGPRSKANENGNNQQGMYHD